MSNHNGSELEARLRAVPANEQAAQPKGVQLHIPVALAVGVFAVVEGACVNGATVLRGMHNELAAGVLESIREELMARTKAMVVEMQRRVIPAAADEMPKGPQ